MALVTLKEKYSSTFVCVHVYVHVCACVCVYVCVCSAMYGPCVCSLCGHILLHCLHINSPRSGFVVMFIL